MHTGLTLALKFRNTLAAEILLALGADPELRPQDHHAPLAHAAHTNQPDIMRLLLSNGANVHSRNPAGCVALTHAAHFGEVY
jgi:ankyrin repeat protein